MEIELSGDGATFAERLKEAMQASGMKQVDLVNAAVAQGVKLGKSYVSQYVTGKTIPRTDILNFLAEALAVDVDWLRDGPSAPQTKPVRRADQRAGNEFHRRRLLRVRRPRVCSSRFRLLGST